MLQLETVPLEAPWDIDGSILSVDTGVSTFDEEFRASGGMIDELLPDLPGDLSLEKEGEGEDVGQLVLFR